MKKYVTFAMAACLAAGMTVCVSAAEDQGTQVQEMTVSEQLPLIDVKSENADQIVHLLQTTEQETVELNSKSATVLPSLVVQTMMSEKKNLRIHVWDEENYEKYSLFLTYEFGAAAHDLSLEFEQKVRDLDVTMQDGTVQKVTGSGFYAVHTGNAMWAYPTGSLLKLYVGDQYEDGTRLFVYEQLDLLPDDETSPKWEVPEEAAGCLVSDELISWSFAELMGREGMKGYEVVDGYVTFPVRTMDFSLEPVFYSRALLLGQEDVTYDLEDARLALLQALHINQEMSSGVQKENAPEVIVKSGSLEKNYDINGDGSVDLSEVLQILRIALKIQTK